ncbi:hypothetical protein EMIHUDRAFT_214195 [Emiliania huxleyi CCMP1516]|uniref:Methyltransferase domain-containing protein n=2 Tax=Emiliania huxleyi TaxID=2903 RepID=A0A0D3IKS0_EMIH1|nr:hypothetical protein EMIHUDRAFT_214195 [Emiliania huxleyi CCMP1516]EOD11855.1 hypothetical protein EMIHUDRAFT_214195 [Emiliania huxleyi CCMP1516]|eukprot:XP_005764284.1 hypothetical protein EMIHUDRAFT_214195 [Emiliania huxleyi CCMP1516]
MHPCCRASAWILIALAADPAAALAASPRKGKATRPAGGGFGAAASKQTSLDAAAKRLLKEAGGDVDVAQEKSFQNAMRALSRSEPELFEAWPSLDSGALMEAKGGLPTGAAHAKLVELFWDAVAAYIPARQRSVGESGMSAKARRPAVLDVGCGDGALLPHLLRAGADAGRYLGIDLSARMVAAAAAAHPAATFRRAARADFLELDPSGEYDCCLLNGAPPQRATAARAPPPSLQLPSPRSVLLEWCRASQFFADQSCLVGAAAAAVRSGGREHGLQVLPAEECAPGRTPPHTLEGHDFYLVALRKK